MSKLQVLDLSDNTGLKGELLSLLWQEDLARSLRIVDLSHTGLTGSLPADHIGWWSQLSGLKLEGCSSMKGSLPTHIGELTSLEELALSLTRLSGGIPSELGQLSLLKSFSVRPGWNIWI